MLNILSRIVQEINAANNFGEAMQILVERVREAISTQACSIFLVDKKNAEYILLATDGLNPKSVGRIRLKFNQGLVGLVGEREEPINVEDAPAHPHFHYAPEVGEERYKAFLGVPIIHQRRLVGVLFVQQEESRRFDEEEEAFLVTMSAQLGGVIAHAEITGELANLINRNVTIHAEQQEVILHGQMSNPGVVIGEAYVVYPLVDLNSVQHRKPKNIKKEINDFNVALERAKSEILNISKRLEKSLFQDEKVLFEAYLKILDSKTLHESIIAEIKAGNWAPGALRKVITSHLLQFEAMEDPYLRERAADLKDLGQRILTYLQEARNECNLYPAKTILIGEEISPAQFLEVPQNYLAGMISLRGSHNSHVAMLARALNIPFIIGVDDVSLNEIHGQEIIVDGYQNQFYINPTKKIRRNYQNFLNHQALISESLEELRTLPAETLDHHRIDLLVNSGLIADTGLSLTVGAEGIGLYRTEIQFMRRNSFPTEDDQYAIYRQILSAFAPRQVIMRTLDIGGDKMLPYFPFDETNASIGWRGIRITLDHPEIFLIQLRAMHRANIGIGNLRILLPMVTNISEIEDAKKLIIQAYNEVRELYATPTLPMPPIGIMAEVPSTICFASAYAKRVDFISVGSNDLTQYLLAVDRNNSRVAALYDSLHPAVLHALMLVVKAARKENTPISICGEMAGDPVIAPLLLAMGFNSLSMSSSVLPKVKWVIRHISHAHAKKLLEKVLTFENPHDTREYLQKELNKIGLGNVIGYTRKFT